MWNPIEAYRRWCQKQYDMWGSKLQEKYDFWGVYDNPELREKCQKIWDKLSPELQKKIYDMLIAILEKYGPEFAKEIIAKLTEAFGKLIKIEL